MKEFAGYLLTTSPYAIFMILFLDTLNLPILPRLLIFACLGFVGVMVMGVGVSIITDLEEK